MLFLSVCCDVPPCLYCCYTSGSGSGGGGSCSASAFGVIKCENCFFI